MANSSSTFAAGGGMITTDFGGADTGFGVTLQNDGKILVAGDTMDADGTLHSLLARYNVDGSLDSSFSGDGKVIIDFGAESLALSVAVQNDGKILASGAIDGGGGADFFLTRYNADGSLDTSFSGDGRLSTDFGGLDVGFSVVTQSDGKILVAGNHDGDFALARYNSDGSLDAGFSGGGTLTTDFGGTEVGGSVVVQGDGKILVAGVSLMGSNWNFAVARYNTNGSLDTTFSGDGKVLTDFGNNQGSITLALQADGKIVVAGGGFTGGLSFNGFGLVRYNTDGTLDTSFSGDGVIVTDFAADSAGQSVKVQSDGRILVGGFSNGDFAMVRYNTDGSLDTSFSGDGKVTTDIGGYDGINGIVIQADGKIVAVGVSGDAEVMTTGDVALARYNTNGTLDTGGTPVDNTPPTVVTFNPADGVSDVAVGQNIVVTFSEAIQKGTGTIAIHSGSAAGTVLESYNAATSPNLAISGNTLTIDPTAIMVSNSHYYVTFDPGTIKDLAGNPYAGTTTYDFTTVSHSGMITTDFGGSDFGWGLAIQPDGKILVSGMTNHDFALARYNANGSLDTTFSGDGKVTLDLGINDFGSGITVQADGKILISGATHNDFTSNGDFVVVRYNPDGSLDTSFSGDGIVTTPIGGDAVGCSVKVQPDGRIVVGGFSNGDFAVARYTANGTLDTTFSGDGIVTTNIGGEDYGSGLMLQTDGKILLAGSTWPGDGHSNFALVRYNTDGSLDTSFSGDGIVTTDIHYRDQGIGMTVQSDGKILVVGESDGDFALVRYNIDGSLDTSFSGDGKVITDIANYDSGWSVTALPGGKILVAGYAHGGIDQPFNIGSDGMILVGDRNSDFALMRYNADGTLDTTFDGDGKVTTDFGGNDIIFSMAVQSDGKIVVSGTSSGDFALARYNTDGSLDTSFTGVPSSLPPMTPMIRNGISVMPEYYTGPATAAGGAPIHFQFIGDSSNEVVIGTAYNDFINVAGGVDAVNAGAGNDVIDGGTGSNFLTGGPGTDIFFSDGRGGVTTWSTITDWQAGEQLSVWGWHPGLSRIVAWVQAGAAGYEGLTMHADLNGDGTIDTSVTFTGIVSQSQLPAPLEFDGVLWFV